MVTTVAAGTSAVARILLGGTVMVRTALLGLGLGLALAASLPADALTLEQALAEATVSNPAVAIARAAIDRARARATSARAWFPSDPALESGFATGGPFGGRERQFEAALEQQFELGGQRGLRTDAAEAEGRAAVLELRRAEQRVTAEVTTAFAEAWRLSERKKVTGDFAASARTLAAAARTRVDAGDLAELAALVVEVDAARAAARLAGARSSERRARAELTRLMGRPALVEDPLDQPEGDGVDATNEAALIERAMALRADVAAARARVEAARTRSALAGRAWLPSPSLRVVYARDLDGVEQGEFSGDPTVIAGIEGTLDDDTLVGIGLSIPIPSFARRAGLTGEAAADVIEAEAEALALERAAAAQVQVARAAQMEAVQNVQLLSEIADRIERSVDLSRRGFEVGELGLSEYLLARNTAFDARGELVDARATIISAQAALLAAVGGN